MTTSPLRAKLVNYDTVLVISMYLSPNTWKKKNLQEESLILTQCQRLSTGFLAPCMVGVQSRLLLSSDKNGVGSGTQEGIAPSDTLLVDFPLPFYLPVMPSYRSTEGLIHGWVSSVSAVSSQTGMEVCCSNH